MRRALLAAVLTAIAVLPAAAQEKPKDWQPPPIEQIPNHRELWRQVLIELGTYAKTRNPNFIVLARDGVELVVKGRREVAWEQARDPDGRTFEKRLPLGSIFRPYVKILDGIVIDGLYCGPARLTEPLDQAIETRREEDARLADEKRRGIRHPPVGEPMGPFSIDPQVELKRAEELKVKAARDERLRHVLRALGALRASDRTILSIEDCHSPAEMQSAFAQGARDHVTTFAAASDSKLDLLPAGHPFAENAAPVTAIPGARNWLPMLRGDRLGSRRQWVMALRGSNYDVLVVDVAYRGSDPLTAADVAALKFKNLGAPRLVLADLPIGRAYDWRWYWRKDWQAGNPPFLFGVDSREPGAYIVDLDNPGWKEVLGKYIAGIMDLGFDGVVLDDLDTYLWFERLMPIPD
ncbi:MAG: hypothetical protein M0006_03930 [Magnetospirillum sp.]|nr:hypothetical protein [Magnetospirillum sp.]